jgi:hypothetical protein
MIMDIFCTQFKELATSVYGGNQKTIELRVILTFYGTKTPKTVSPVLPI